MKKKEKMGLHAMKPEELEREAASLEQKIKHWDISRYTKSIKNTREATLLRRRLAVVKSIRKEKESIHE